MSRTAAAPPSVIVVGAGIAGLAAAVRLTAAGVDVTVVDKGRGVGGRLATRRIGDATLDHGAPFVESPAGEDRVFGGLADAALEAWPDAASGRSRGRPGMTGVAKHLARDLDVRTSVRVEALRPTDDCWWVEHTDGSLPARAVVLTAPLPQSLDLLGDVDAFTAERQAALDAVAYHPALVLLVVLDGPSAVPPPGLVMPDDGPFRVVTDHRHKGVSAVPALSLEVGPTESAALFDRPDDAVLDDLLPAAAPYVAGASATAVQVKRWRYARPARSLESGFEAATGTELPLLLAGDAFMGGNVPGAWQSGVRAADHVLGGPPAGGR